MTMFPHASASNFAPPRSTLGGVAYGAAAGALWGVVFLAPELVRDFNPLLLAIGRYLFYGLISAVLLAPRWRVFAKTVTQREWLVLAWLGFAGNTLYYVLLSSAVQVGGIAMTSLVIGFLPVAVTIIGSRDRNAIPLVKLVPSLLLCAAGAVCIGWQAVAEPAAVSVSERVTGLLCAVGALASWTAYAVGNSRWLARLDHFSAHDWNLLTGIATGAQSLLLLPLAIIFDPTHHGGHEWGRFVVVSTGVAVFASIIGNAFWNRMSRLLPLTLVGQMILFETLFALIYGFLWEHRLPEFLEMVSFTLVVLSVLTCVAAHRGKGRPISTPDNACAVSGGEP
jgi:drug/metabolite transporter (DMT)-like permease